MTCTPGEIQAIADHVLAASDAGSSIEPVTDTLTGFSLEDAYRVSARITERRTARGERPIGWKIGFTNRTIWDEYGVHAPIWAPMYDSTVEGTDEPTLPVLCSLFGLVEPRIEPEIIFRIATPPQPEMEAPELLSCIDAVAHGFEIVQSLFPGWRFAAPDTVAAFALHGRLRHGPLVPLDADQDRAEWAGMLSNFEIGLKRDGVAVDRGAAVNVLDGPLFALAHFVRGLVDDPLGRRLQVGDLVSTGTITRAFPVCPGETWTSEVIGLPLPGMSIAFF
jgi:2-keto-4-pentenoate hydratase